MNITNINTENGIIYFHANSVPYFLENMNNEYAINKVLKKQEGFELTEQELEHTDFVNEYEQYLDLYILELKYEWIKIDSSDIDNYLSEIDSDYFDSEFCEGYISNGGDFLFEFIIDNKTININYCNVSKTIELDNYPKCVNKTAFHKVDLETANEIFQTMYRESDSYLAVVAKQILIRSHQHYLYQKNKE